MPGMKVLGILAAVLIFASSVRVPGGWSGEQAAPSRPASTITVPFIGCRADGQLGPTSAPNGTTHPVSISAGAAERLAWYKSQYGYGILAPRGWYCFSTYGSNGGSLYVSPQPIDSQNVFSPEWKGFSGEAVQLSESVGDTSGRFQVAKIIARVFPAYAGFAHNVIAEGIEPANSFPFGPWPQDKLTYRGNRIVEFETPPHAMGLGTESRLQPDAEGISGVAMLVGEAPDLIQLTIRLSASDKELTTVIVQQVEQLASDGESSQ